MAISFVNTWAIGNNTGSSSTISTNGGSGSNPTNSNSAQVGDVLVWQVASFAVATSATPSGWSVAVPAFSSSLGVDIVVFYKVVAAGDINASFTVNFASSGPQSALGIVCLRGVNQSNPIDAAGSVNAPASGDTATANSITLSSSGDALLYCLSYASTTQAPTPSGFTRGPNVVYSSGTIIGGMTCYELGVASGATGGVTSNLTGTSGYWDAVLVALAPTAGAPLPLMAGRGRWEHKQIPRVRAKHNIRSGWLINRQVTAPHADFPQSVRHRGQRRRVPVIKAKPRVRNRWIEERQVTAPHADLPLSVRHGLQKKRVPQIKAKKLVRSSIELRIPQAPPINLPLAVRHARGQPKRTPHIKAKRIVRSSLELRVPQAPHADFPVGIRHRGQRRRIPQVKRKRQVFDNLELRIPQAPHADAALPLAARKGQKKRPPHVLRKRRGALHIPQAPTASTPLPIGKSRQRDRSPHLRSKRIVRGSPQLRIPQTLVPVVSIAPFPVIHARPSRRRLFLRRSRHWLRGSLFAEIPQAPPPSLPSTDIIARWRIRGGPAGSSETHSRI